MIYLVHFGESDAQDVDPPPARAKHRAEVTKAKNSMAKYPLVSMAGKPLWR